jgi:hypothetical protein
MVSSEDNIQNKLNKIAGLGKEKSTMSGAQRALFRRCQILSRDRKNEGR